LRFVALRVTTSLKIPGAVIPRNVFTQPGSKPEWSLTALMSAFAGSGPDAVIGPYESEEAAFRAASMHVLVTGGLRWRGHFLVLVHFVHFRMMSLRLRLRGDD
jgi:hypothetical protein